VCRGAEFWRGCPQGHAGPSHGHDPEKTCPHPGRGEGPAFRSARSRDAFALEIMLKQQAEATRLHPDAVALRHASVRHSRPFIFRDPNLVDERGVSIFVSAWPALLSFAIDVVRDANPICLSRPRAIAGRGVIGAIARGCACGMPAACSCQSGMQC